MKAIRRFLLLLFSASILISCSLLSGIIFAVDSGAIKVPQDYPTIQEAVDAANPGDTILVGAGTYSESVYINKSLIITGEGAPSTNVGAFNIHADNVTISGFTTEPLLGPTIYLFNSSGCNISNNIVRGIYYVITLHKSSDNFIGYNTVLPNDNGWGIQLYDCSDNNIIRGNHVKNAPKGVGIFLQSCLNNTVIQNKVVNCADGINALQSSHNEIRSNMIENNIHGISLVGANNLVYHNNLISNVDKVVNIGRNVWDNGAEGNYWDDYNGTDMDGDGIGDTYLPWEGVDYYPLITPWTRVRTFYVAVNETVYPVTIYSYSTIASFGFNKSMGHVSFNATGPHNVQGFCNVTVPKVVLDGHLLVLVDAGVIDFTQVENETHNCVWFTYTHSTHRIRITEYTTPIMGDLNYDGRVNLYDIVMAAAAYGSTPEDPNWNPLADVAPQYELVDIYDLVTIASHYGETYQC